MTPAHRSASTANSEAYITLPVGCVNGRLSMAVRRSECVVGFNPYRKQRHRPSDYVLVLGALLVTALLVVWAVRG